MARAANVVLPLNLRRTAGAIARNYGDKDAIVITFSGDGLTRVGVENLTPEELREALCTAIRYSFVFADEAVKEPDETGWFLSLFRAYEPPCLFTRQNRLAWTLTP